MSTSCLTNRTNGGSSTASSRWAIYKAAAYRGQITHEVWIGGASTAVDTIAEGEFFYRWARGALTGRGAQYPAIVSHRAEVRNADGDGYHRSARFHNYKVASAGCAEVMGSAPSYDATGGYSCVNHYGNYQ